jgi:hypothetical protein
MHRFIASASAVVLLTTGTVIARDGADDTNKWAWGENIGWTNWADAGDGMEAACLDTDHLEGFVWGENIGFINLGNGDGPYTNTDGIDFGVNIDPMTGEASGFAWGENVGWINFGTTAFVGTDGARYDFSEDRFRGFAWGENIGWINLDDDTNFVSLNAATAGCPGDCNGDNQVNFSDLTSILFQFGTDGGGVGCDVDGSGTVNFSDLTAALFAFGPCP